MTPTRRTIVTAVLTAMAMMLFVGTQQAFAKTAGASVPVGPPGPARHQHYAGFPINVGQVGPIAPNNPLEEPFACETQHTDLGQPVVDNQAGIGYPVTDSQNNVIGYSKNCGARTIVEYFYLPAGSGPDAALKPYDLNNPPSPGAVAKINIGKHHEVPMIVRYEAGTINRYIYAIAVVTPHPSKDLNDVDMSVWNHNLVFLFGGGVGIGYDQAAGGYPLSFVEGAKGRLLSPAQGDNQDPYGRALLEHGYALAASSGNVTATDYNLRLMGQTSVMIKEQFIARYGKPRFTFATGGSGGAIQQFIYAQDFPGLLNGIIVTKPYPDMITQVNPVGDCELLEFYFDQGNKYYNSGSDNPFWESWPNRQLIEGMNGINGFQSAYAAPGGSIQWATAQMGSDECIEGWFGLTPYVFNPLWPEINPDNLPQLEMAGTHWDFFDDLKTIFGVNPANGYAYQTFDNVGVQYGLLALRRGEITPDEFLNINAGVGGWKETWQMVAPGYPFDPTSTVMDPWSYRNANDVFSPGFTGIAPRTAGNISAMKAAYRSGLVFMGAVNVPIIDIMDYLEPELNMHSSRESFVIRQRLIDARGNANNQVIWGIPGYPGVAYALDDLVLKALKIETKWLETGHRPADAMDACYTQTGALIAKGPHVWSGEMTGEMDGNSADDPNPGACTQQDPIYSSSRLMAGDPLSEMTFKCALKSVSQALSDGTYGNVTFSSAQQQRLEEIFPTGVCDYSKPDQGRPDVSLSELIKEIHNYPGE